MRRLSRRRLRSSPSPCGCGDQSCSSVLTRCLARMLRGNRRCATRPCHPRSAGRTTHVIPVAGLVSGFRTAGASVAQRFGGGSAPQERLSPAPSGLSERSLPGSFLAGRRGALRGAERSAAGSRTVIRRSRIARSESRSKLACSSCPVSRHRMPIGLILGSFRRQC